MAGCLRKIDLSFNQLKDLPLAFSILVNLEYLNLSHNAFEQVPAALLLRPERNHALAEDTSSPPEQSLAGSLRHLSMSSNRLSSLPDNFALGFTRLENLLLAQNRFKRIPSAVYGLSSLLALSLSQNGIAETGDASANQIDPSFEQMRCLKTLDLSGNAFTSLDLVVPVSLTSLNLSANRSLAALALSQRVTSTQESKKHKLKRLEIHKCSLSSLPSSFARFDHLQFLRASENPWDEKHNFMRSNPLPMAVNTWIKIRDQLKGTQRFPSIMILN